MAGDIIRRAKALFVRDAPEPPPVVPRKATKRFHAVTIAPGPRACAAALALSDQRFLSKDAPPLPLKGCDAFKCECRYEHHDDRRKGNRRTQDMGVSIDGYAGNEQREKSKRGRRETDRK